MNFNSMFCVAGGALGLGGGFLVVPALNSLMGLEPRKSIGASAHSKEFAEQQDS